MHPKIYTKGIPVANRRYVRYAINLFMNKVMQHRTIEKIEYIKVVADNTNLDSCSWACTEIHEMHDGVPVGYLISIDVTQVNDINKLTPLIMHEMTHVWQFATGKLNFRLDKRGQNIVRYKRRRYNLDKMHYSLQPWEIEAHGYELCITSLFWEDYNNNKIATGRKKLKSPKIEV